MWIDVVFLLLLVMAVFRGLRHGLIIAVVSALAFLIGLAAAIKLSATVAGYLKNNMHMSTRWLPVLAFVWHIWSSAGKMGRPARGGDHRPGDDGLAK